MGKGVIGVFCSPGMAQKEKSTAARSAAPRFYNIFTNKCELGFWGAYREGKLPDMAKKEESTAFLVKLPTPFGQHEWKMTG